jgi:transposase
VKTGSFVQDARGRWYVCLQCDVPDAPQLALALDPMGIDLGLTDQIVCSDGVKYSRKNLTRQYEDELTMAQRAGKKNHIKAIHAKIQNVRKDWTHKVTTAIVKRSPFLYVGDVSSTKLAKTCFAKSTYDAGWGITRAQPSLQRRKGGDLQSQQACWVLRSNP